MSRPLEETAAAPAALEWSFNPWRERPHGVWRVLAALLFCWAVVMWLGLPGLQAAALCGAAALMLLPALMPVRCRLDDLGVTRWSGMVPERRAWSQLQRAERTNSGVLLSPFASRHWLDAYRALFLPVPRDQADRVRGPLDDRLRRHGL